MTQQELNSAVARATGESARDIARRGFSLADPARVAYDPEPSRRPLVVDWDDVQQTRSFSMG